VIDLVILRRTIAGAPEGEGACATVSRSYLEQIERELLQGRLDAAELAAMKRGLQMVEAIAGGRR
jgi:hypothetical protein